MWRALGPPQILFQAREVLAPMAVPRPRACSWVSGLWRGQGHSF